MSVRKSAYHLSLYLRCIQFYRKSINWSRQQIDDYHNLKLIEIVKHAGTHVPYYREIFSEAGIDINRFRGLEDISRIPLLDKETLRTRHQDFIADNAAQYYPVWSKTSGSTGTPLNVMLDMISVRNKQRVIARSAYWAGARIGRSTLKIKGLSESKPKDYGYELKSNTIYLNASRLTKSNCVEVAKLVQKLRPNFYIGYPRSFIDFYHHISEAGISLPPPAGILCYGESISPSVRAHIQKVSQTHLYDLYANIENSVLACEMPDHHQYFMEDYFYPELIDAEGNVTDSGSGELVGTSFYSYAMPLIRYKTRDRIILAQRDETHLHPFIPVQTIEGRMDDYILLPDGRKIYFAEGALGYAKGVVAAQYIQDAPDHVTVNMIVDDEFKKEYYPEIEKGLIKRIGDTLRYSFNLVTELEKNKSGKTPFIINKIK